MLLTRTQVQEFLRALRAVRPARRRGGRNASVMTVKVIVIGIASGIDLRAVSGGTKGLCPRRRRRLMISREVKEVNAKAVVKRRRNMYVKVDERTSVLLLTENMCMISL